MPRRILFALLLAVLGALGCFSLGGCAKPVALADTVVRAATPEEWTECRADLGNRFSAEQLQPLETALLELKLDAMNRDIKSAEAREAQVRSVIHAQTVRQVETLGWQARHRRILSEIEYLEGLLANDLKAQQTSTSTTLATHIQNEQEILARLRRDLAATARQLAAWADPSTTANP